MRPAKDVRVGFPRRILQGLRGQAKLLAYDGDEQDARIETDGDTARITIPELRLWTLVAIE